MPKSRVFASAALAGVLVIAGLSAGPAFAEDGLAWSPVSSVTTADGVTVTWETAMSTTPFNGNEVIDPVPVYRPEITNGSSVARFFGFGTDVATQGVVEQLWEPSAWGVFADEFGGELSELFWVEIPVGGTFSTSDGQARTWYDGMPAWSGHTITIFELSEAPIDSAAPVAAPVASVSTPGRFAPADVNSGSVDNLSAVMGKRATVSGDGGTPELFPGLTSTVEASGLTPGDHLELWIAKDFNYAYFQILGGGLPVGALKVGDGTVGADEKLTATFTLPNDLDYGQYQLVAGVRAERYWPAGTYDDFQVTTPDATNSVPSTGAGSVSIPVGPTLVTLTYPAGTTAGSTSVTVSGTGPAVGGFQLLTDPPLYYHLDTTATLGGPATVCISFDPGILSPYPPQLFHFDTALNRWVDITTTRGVGEVCGVTSTFSPFVIGYVEPETFDFSGFFSPVSMTAENIAKPGQAIPVKFSLHGDQGLDVVTSARFVAEGNTTSLVGEVIDTTTAGGSGLSYDARSDRYTYVWKTPKTLSLKKGYFELSLSDGARHTFDVTFKK